MPFFFYCVTTLPLWLAMTAVVVAVVIVQGAVGHTWTSAAKRRNPFFLCWFVSSYLVSGHFFFTTLIDGNFAPTWHWLDSVHSKPSAYVCLLNDECSPCVFVLLCCFTWSWLCSHTYNQRRGNHLINFFDLQEIKFYAWGWKHPPASNMPYLLGTHLCISSNG